MLRLTSLANELANPCGLHFYLMRIVSLGGTCHFDKIKTVNSAKGRKQSYLRLTEEIIMG